MHLVVAAIGRLKQGPERELLERYHERAANLGGRIGFRSVYVHEMNESRARDAATRMTEEARYIEAVIGDKTIIVALDERGKNLDSATFAGHLRDWRDSGTEACAFVIGGADGLSPDLKRKAKLSIAFGALTWPHQLVRVLLLEQIYRATTILSGHPYHRA